MKLPLKTTGVFLIFALLISCVAATENKDLPTKKEITDFIAGIPVSDNYIITVFNALKDKQPTWNCDIWVDKNGNQILSLYYVDPDSAKGYGSIYFNELGKEISTRGVEIVPMPVKSYVGKAVSEETTEFAETSEPTIVETPVSSSASVNLYGEKTQVVKGEDILLKLSSVNLITKPTMHVQVIIIPPSGMSVSSSEFVESGAGQYITMYDIKPGMGRDIEVRIAANQVGNFNVIGRVIYYFGENKKDAVAKTLNLPIQVDEAPSTQSSTLEDKTPGFGAASLIMMLMLAFVLRRN